METLRIKGITPVVNILQVDNVACGQPIISYLQPLNNYLLLTATSDIASDYSCLEPPMYINRAPASTNPKAASSENNSNIWFCYEPICLTFPPMNFQSSLTYDFIFFCDYRNLSNLSLCWNMAFVVL